MFDCHKTRGQQILWQKGWHVLGTTWIWHLWPRSWEIKLSYTWWLTLSLDPGYTIHQKTSAPSHISASLPAALRRSQTDIPPPPFVAGNRCEDQRAALKIADKLKNLDPKLQETPITESWQGGQGGKGMNVRFGCWMLGQSDAVFFHVFGCCNWLCLVLVLYGYMICQL